MHSLRGYRDEQFFVQNAVTVQFEPTIQLRLSSIYLFTDVGFLEIPIAGSAASSEIESGWRFEYSNGLGLRLSDTRRRLEFGLGWGRDIPLGEPRLFVELSESL
jgi:hemolysin activation/secretion protein